VGRDPASELLAFPAYAETVSISAGASLTFNEILSFL
jgi:hypothetical protein